MGRCVKRMQENQNQNGSWKGRRSLEGCRVYIDRNNNVVFPQKQEEPVEVLHHPSQSASPNPRRRTRRRNYPPGYYYNDNNNMAPAFLRQCPYRQPELASLVDEDEDDYANLLHELSIEEKERICAEFMEKHFKCPICLDVFVEPLGISCGHKFCRTCIYDWLRIKWTCPVCIRPVLSQHLELDINNAICSVASHLSTDWQERHTFLQDYRVFCRVSASALAPLPPSTFLLPSLPFNRIISGILSPLEFLIHLGVTLCQNALQLYTWLREQTQLVDVVIGMLLVGFLVLLWGFGDRIVDFFQYMYLAINLYDPNLPAAARFAVLRKPVDRMPFEGPSDTIFARILKRFY